MPLLEMSPNIQESEARARKRSHDEFEGDAPTTETEEATKDLVLSPKKHSVLLALHQSLGQSTPQGSPSLTEPGSITPAHIPGSPITPKAETIVKCDPAPNSIASNTETASATPQNTVSTSTTTTQPQKKKRLTAAEKEARDKEAAEKKKEKEEKAAAKAAEKAAKVAKAEEEKAAKAKEREEKQKKKAEEEAARAKERDEKQKKKAEEERVKEEKKRQAQEAKEKEARKQPKLNSFFGAPRTPSKPSNTESAPSRTASPNKSDPAADTTKPADAEYRKRFKPFFVKEHTRLANSSWCMDEDTRESKSRILDEFISGDRTLDSSSLPFDPVEVFALPRKPPKRGRVHPPVRTVMESIYRETEANNASTSQSAIALARQQLSRMVTKVISFSQDVRPAYCGTTTAKQHAVGLEQMRKAARNTNAKRLPLDYDYDSEAEWQEDEDGEDVDMEDDDEDVEDEDDMDGFLDDSEDVGPARRLLVNTLEPECSGICFEDHNKNGPNPAVYEHRMEFIIDHNDASSSINPWSDAYWEPAPKKVQAADMGVVMPPPPAPTSAFAALSGTPTAPAATKLVKKEILNDVKKAILDNKGLSKVGIVDFVFNQFRDNASRAEVKNTIELVAENKKKGTGRHKEWDLKPGHEIAL
ncbi:unnamed protein product [Clonostachys rhizophaga]|uniref:Chromatin assembly factor 1 subunit A n=1 Tax=Clonostachys rhizophaga TaxID=160324 RepID=A0A9N9V845_9HYPO|nr:unnamed protein product [Clonostachys rhizophaga]